MKKSKVDGMKNKPAGGADRAPFGSNLIPTNASKAVGGLKKMLSAIKHIGRPSKGGKMPFGK